MRPEQRMWAQLSKAMGNAWHATRHEDTITKGLPDVSFGADGVQGWIELKVLERWSGNPKTIIRLPLFTAEQKAWLTLRGARGGRCFLLLKIEAEDLWLLFGHRVLTDLGRMTQEEMLASAIAVWDGVPSNQSLLSRITAK